MGLSHEGETQLLSKPHEDCSAVGEESLHGKFHAQLNGRDVRSDRKQAAQKRRIWALLTYINNCSRVCFGQFVELKQIISVERTLMECGPQSPNPV